MGNAMTDFAEAIRHILTAERMASLVWVAVAFGVVRILASHGLWDKLRHRSNHR